VAATAAISRGCNEVAMAAVALHSKYLKIFPVRRVIRDRTVSIKSTTRKPGMTNLEIVSPKPGLLDMIIDI